MGRILSPYNILDAKTHVDYTKYVKDGGIPKKHKADGREEMRLILKTLCKNIAEGITEYPGGTYIKRIGYFFNWKCPRKMSYHLNRKGGRTEHFNHHTNHYMYFPTFLPDASKIHVRSTWTMDKKFNHSLTTRVRDRLYSGFKYRNYLHSLKL